MIIDKLNNTNTPYTLSAGLLKGLQFLRETDLTLLSIGRQDIDGDDCFAFVNEYETKPLPEGVWEAHRSYIDIQYLVSGIERMGYAPVEGMKPITPYDDEKDLEFLEGKGDFFLVNPGTIVVFTPDDAHMPNMQAGSSCIVRKVVVKVRV